MNWGRYPWTLRTSLADVFGKQAGSITTASAHERHYESFGGAYAAVEADLKYVEANASDLRVYFVGNNYRMVLRSSSTVAALRIL